MKPTYFPRTFLFWASLAAAMIGIAAFQFFLDPWLSQATNWGLQLRNLLPPLLVFIFFLGLSRRPLFSGLLVLTLLLFLFHVNEIRLNTNDQPVLFSDIYLLPQLITGFELMGHYSLGYWLLVIAAGIVLASGVLLWLEPPGFRFSRGVFVALVVGLGFISLGSGNYPLGSLYDEESVVSNAWEPLENAQQSGLIASLVRDSQRMPPRFAKPDRKIIDQFRSGMANQSDEPDFSSSSPRPDIILILSESFFDPAIIKGIEVCEFLPTLCELGELGLRTDIDVPAYGGNTTRTEYEVLTGVPFERLSGTEFPYLTVVTEPKRSVARELKQAGYETLALHSHTRTFWQRQRAFPLLGFDQFIARDEFQRLERRGYYISDHILMEEIVHRLENRSESKPQFIFAISMENHGPWGDRPELDPSWRSIEVPSELAAADGSEWQQYIFHARTALDSLIQLYNYIEKRQRPTLVVFFGDHLPGMSDSFSQLEFDNGAEAYKQLTPLLAIANYPLNSDWYPSEAWMLAPWLFELTGVRGQGNLTHLNRLLDTESDQRPENHEKIRHALQQSQLVDPPE